MTDFIPAGWYAAGYINEPFKPRYLFVSQGCAAPANPTSTHVHYYPLTGYRRRWHAGGGISPDTWQIRHITPTEEQLLGYMKWLTAGGGR